jgi:hypothetical protein
MLNPWWGVVGTIASVVAIAVTIVIALFQHQFRRISYKRRTMKLVAVDASIRESVQIYYSGEPVHDVHLIEYDVRNSGTAAIKPGDFDGPLIVTFTACDRLLSAELSSTPTGRPIELKINQDTAPPKLFVAPTLLNPADGFVITAIVSGESPSQLAVRVADMKLPVDETDQSAQPRRLAITPIVILAALLTVLLVSSNVTILLTILLLGAIAATALWGYRQTALRRNVAISAVAVGAIALLTWQTYSVRQQLATLQKTKSLETAASFFREWQSPQMLQARADSAATYPRANERTLQVFNFFERLGVASDQGIVSHQDTSDYFRDPIMFYWCAYEPWIETTRRSSGEDPANGDLFHSFQSLVRYTRQLDHAQCPSALEIQNLLEIEIQRNKQPRSAAPE